MTDSDSLHLPNEAALEQALTSSRVLVDAPESTIQRALALFAHRAVTVSADSPSQTRSLATRVFDSLTTSPLALGLRSDRQGARQLLFSAEGRDIDLRISRMRPELSSRFTLAGQIFGPDAAGQAELRATGYHAKQAWNEWSEFRFADVPAGPCTLLLTGDDWQIELPAFDITIDA